MAVANGVATLDSGGKVPLSQLPSSIPVGWSTIVGDPLDNAGLGDIFALYIPLDQKGAVSGVAELDGSGKVPLSQLPSLGDAGGVMAIRVVTTNSTLDATTDTFISVNASGGNIVITLPTAGACSDGKFYYIKKKDSTANTVTIVGSGVETIDGASSVVLDSAGQVINVIYTGTGTDWDVF
jgi:hypothetical protein